MAGQAHEHLGTIENLRSRSDELIKEGRGRMHVVIRETQITNMENI